MVMGENAQTVCIRRLLIMSATSTVVGKMAKPVGRKSIRELLIDDSSKIRQAIGG